MGGEFRFDRFDDGNQTSLQSDMAFEQGEKFRAQSVAALCCKSVKREKWQHGRTPVDERQASAMTMKELACRAPAR
ncbi:hypothetical protein EOS_23170 [Caballeronia mineralivorans PML1(12)]|uniref:Uncharacterized protein n=1 Tax=Caballeronia mineralivorans PML1(12) TaxID=908627 RepID=A0A0J1CU39_9BURK|nr:hypothetical protein EOS_23170 [Caballeronia mineralivorans PML1(12)]